MIVVLTGNGVWIVLPAYNASKTLRRTIEKIPIAYRKNLILVDDCSTDDTVFVARTMGISVVEHEFNSGYGANQKTCYQKALEMGAQVVVMLHPDDQYDARVVGIMADLILLDNCDVVLGNRIRTRKEALSGGMPLWRYLINRISTLVENLLLGQTVGDFHSGLRAYSRNVLETIPYEANSNSFVFDQEFLIQSVYFGFRIADIPVPAKYESDSSSISFRNTLYYGVGTLRFLALYFLNKLGIITLNVFKSKKRS